MWEIRSYLILLTISLLVTFSASELVIGQSDVADETTSLFTIEGKVFPPDMFYSPMVLNKKWHINTVLNINNGEYKGFLRDDGSFVLSGVPSGSYVLEINNPDFYYEPVRVEINPKGKFRARKVNFIQPAQIMQVPYPLRLKALTRFRYFQQREQWKITDLLFNPMVLMMVLPLLLMLLLPKMISDPETKKEIENIQLPKMTSDMPEISEIFTSLFTGGAKQPEREKKPINPKQNKKRN